MAIKRNYFDPVYKDFRKKVRARDKRCCRWPECGAKRKLQVHHILPWTQFPAQRYDVNNGITLCKKHHKLVTGNELSYARMLGALICLK